MFVYVGKLLFCHIESIVDSLALKEFAEDAVNFVEIVRSHAVAVGLLLGQDKLFLNCRMLKQLSDSSLCRALIVQIESFCRTGTMKVIREGQCFSWKAQVRQPCMATSQVD